MEHVEQMSEILNDCLVPKLAQDFQETINHPEFYIRDNTLKDNFHKIINLITEVDLRTNPLASLIISKFMILYEELRSEGPWSSFKCKQYALKMDQAFDSAYGITLNKILRSTVFNAQEIFDVSIKILHEKMTPKTYRKYPGLVEVYLALLQNDYELSINPRTVLPISLLLIDDYDPANKLKGLNCCSSVLLCLNDKSFNEGNFYEVVLSSLLNAINEKEIEIISVVLENLVQLLIILPAHAKKPAVDKIFANVLDQIITESNLYRKAACLNFIANLIEIHAINCINRKSFKNIMYNCFDECSNDMVAEILFPSAIEVFEMWIKFCWCTWRLSSDHKILSLLFKLLYITREESFVNQIQNIIITLIGLCSKKEQTEIIQSVVSPPNIKNEEFVNRLQHIKNNLTM